MKVIIIDFSGFNGIRNMYCTHYYVNGKRVSQNTYYSMENWIMKEYDHHHTELKSDVNKDGIKRDYTIIHYVKKSS